MKIKQLLEFVDEDFKQMSQQATNIQQGKGNATDAQLRQQRIQQLAANQQARNAAPAGKTIVPPPATTPATTGTAPTTAPTTTTAPAATTTTQPITTAPAGQKPGINWSGIGKGAGDIASQAAGGIAQTVGAAAGGIGAGYHTARQKQSFGSANRGYGPGTYKGDPYQGGSTGGAAPTGGNSAGDAEVAKLKSDIAAITGRLDKAGIAEKKR